MSNKKITLYLIFISVLLAVVIGWYSYSFTQQEREFNGERALLDVQTQVAFGPRTPGSAGQAEARAWMRTELIRAGWDVEIHKTNALGYPIQNLIAKRNDEPPQIIIGAHYDTRFFADNDPDPANQHSPVPGANDGASGVAVLLELARTLSKDSPSVWLVFFDAEDNGRIEGWDWILGSRAFANEYAIAPEAVIIVDMIGDADLNIHYERNSNIKLREEIWATANQLGYSQFIANEKFSMLDDHTPFLEKGIPAVDIIDFDYPYWHTTQDTPDKVSAQSLEAVGETLRVWVMERK